MGNSSRCHLCALLAYRCPSSLHAQDGDGLNSQCAPEMHPRQHRHTLGQRARRAHTNSLVSMQHPCAPGAGSEASTSSSWEPVVAALWPLLTSTRVAVLGPCRARPCPQPQRHPLLQGQVVWGALAGCRGQGSACPPPAQHSAYKHACAGDAELPLVRETGMAHMLRRPWGWLHQSWQRWQQLARATTTPPSLRC